MADNINCDYNKFLLNEHFGLDLDEWNRILFEYCDAMKASQSVTEGMMRFRENDDKAENELVSRVNILLFQMLKSEMSDFLKKKKKKKFLQNVQFDFGEIFNQFFAVSGVKNLFQQNINFKGEIF